MSEALVAVVKPRNVRKKNRKHFVKCSVFLNLCHGMQVPLLSQSQSKLCLGFYHRGSFDCDFLDLCLLAIIMTVNVINDVRQV